MLLMVPTLSEERLPDRRDATGKVHILPCVPGVTATDSYFDNTEEPVLFINPGDVVIVETCYHHLDQNIPGVTIEQILEWHVELKKKYYNTTYAWPGGPHKEATHHTLTGPIYVWGARPGDVLEIEILDFDLKPYGFQEMLPGAPVLPEEAGKGAVWWYYVNKTAGKVEVAKGVEIPIRPFIGVVGVALPEPGRYSGTAPGKHGGNLDTPEMTVGSVLYLPVWVTGALLKLGDFHVAQGYGEVTTSALEGAAWVTIRVNVRRDIQLTVPMISTPTHWVLFGLDTDLDEALKKAVKNTIDFITWNYGIDRRTAYAIASMGVDFVIAEAVNMMKNVEALVPKSLFVGYPDRNTLKIPAGSPAPPEMIVADSFIKSRD